MAALFTLVVYVFPYHSIPISQVLLYAHLKFLELIGLFE